MTRIRGLIVTALLGMCGSAAAGEEGLFPFVVSYDSPANATNVSAWLDRPAGSTASSGPRVGRLTNDAGPVRFWATNICFEGCFPTHEQAPGWPPGWPDWASTACVCTTWTAFPSGGIAPIS